MTKTQKLYFSYDVVLYPLLIVMIMWVVFWIEIRFSVDFTSYGIHPGRLDGLRGVLFGPFIHGSLKHLFNNSIPMLVLGTALFYFYRPVRWQVLLIGFIATGFITWFIGRPANHIGASGIVYLLASFLFFKGIISSSQYGQNITVMVGSRPMELRWQSGLPFHEECSSAIGHHVLRMIHSV